MVSPFKVALYARVSTKTQADKKLSIPVQLGLMRAHVKSSGWQEVAAFEEPGSPAHRSSVGLS